MDLRTRRKQFRRAAARYGLFFSYWLLNKMPYGMVKNLLNVMISIGFATTARLKKIARESLRIAFGKQKTAEEIEEIVRRCFANFGQGMVEMIYFNEHYDMMDRYVSVKGREHLDAALAKGKGVVAVTAHFGNFPLMMMFLSRLGYKGNVLMRNTRDPVIDEFLLKKRTAAGLKTIFTMPRKSAVMGTLKALRGNEIVYMLMDQNFGSDGGVFIDFFGQKAATATGPVVLAMRAGAPIVPLFIRREDNGINSIVIEPEMELEKSDDFDEAVLANVVKITKIIEDYIRRYPHEWGWMHRRWKTAPPEGAKLDGN